ncbi:MAG: hypothetical protein II453_06470 [Alphaproteobacteria bacterium]|jgi:cell shape-determining protein MreC|nr:hypothetical protein [Alphaproteobacteria bacterium]MBQ3946305.1 hypothetical protein [Alphaproteobacteria bacterium]
MAQSKHDFLETFHNKQLKDLDEWVWNWYKLASDRQEEIERLKKQKASETVKETNKKLREENNKLKAKLAKISTLTSSNVVVADVVNADA